jgi:hypothetical protein
VGHRNKIDNGITMAAYHGFVRLQPALKALSEPGSV